MLCLWLNLLTGPFFLHFYGCQELQGFDGGPAPNPTKVLYDSTEGETTPGDDDPIMILTPSPVLPGPAKYWLSITALMNSTDVSAARWSWNQRNSTAAGRVGAPFHLFSFSNAFSYSPKGTWLNAIVARPDRAEEADLTFALYGQFSVVTTGTTATTYFTNASLTSSDTTLLQSTNASLISSGTTLLQSTNALLKSSDNLLSANLVVILGVGILGGFLLIACIVGALFCRRKVRTSQGNVDNGSEMQTKHPISNDGHYSPAPAIGSYSAGSNYAGLPSGDGSISSMSAGQTLYSAAPSLGSNSSGSSYGAIAFGHVSAGTPDSSNAGMKGMEIPFHELAMDKEIGHGAFGVVYKGSWRGGVVAIKKLVMPGGQPNAKELNEFRGEAATMQKLRPHMNIVTFLGFTTEPELTIVTEFLERGSLLDALRKGYSFNISTLIKGVAAGMNHLHAEGIIHRDLAARNVLISADDIPKISDFGLSRDSNPQGSNQTKSDIGPLKWMPPEAIRDKVYSAKSDVWSYGVTVWEIVARQNPYPHLDPVQAALKVASEGSSLEFPPATPTIVRRVCEQCWQFTPQGRPTMQQLFAQLSAALPADWA